MDVGDGGNASPDFGARISAFYEPPPRISGGFPPARISSFGERVLRPEDDARPRSGSSEEPPPPGMCEQHYLPLSYLTAREVPPFMNAGGGCLLPSPRIAEQ
jgi:hypothetical protein